MPNSKPRIKKRKSRRKLGARAYKQYTPEMLEIAVESVANKTISSRDAENQFGIPRRTILNKLKNRHSKAVGTPTRLTEEEENKLVNVLLASADYGSPLTKLDLRIVVHNYLKKNGKDDLFNGKMPGEKWVNSFLSRHSERLTVRSTQNISTSRAEKGEEEIMNYFNNLRETLKGVPPANILNYDETNCSDDPGSSKAIFRRGVKYPERIINSTKGCVSLMFSGTADGECLPPYVVYKAEHLYNGWFLNGPDNARYNCTRSGWFDSGIFEDYFRTVVLKWAKNLSGPKVVIGDNLSSHLSPEIVKLCEEHDIKFVFLPPNSTHLTQPLDVAFFGPLKKEWRKILFTYKAENPSQKTMNKKHFPQLLKTLMENIGIRNNQNLKSGFRTTGIYPFNPREVLKRIPEFQFCDSTAYQIDESLLDYLKQSRAPNPMKVARNKKIHVEPGTSVTVKDLEIKNLLTKPQSKNKNKDSKLIKRKENEKNTLKKVKTVLNKRHKKNEEKEVEEIKEKDIYEITEYTEETENETYEKRVPLVKIENQIEQDITKKMLNQDTGVMQTIIITSATIENPRLTPKARNNISQTNLKTPAKKRSKKLQSTSSTSIEDICMSVHSDSDLDEINLDLESSTCSNLDITIQEIIDANEEDEDIKKRNEDREAKIFSEIMSRDLETDIETVDTKKDDRVAIEVKTYLEEDRGHGHLVSTNEGMSRKNEEELQAKNNNIDDVLTSDKDSKMDSRVAAENEKCIKRDTQLVTTQNIEETDKRENDQEQSKLEGKDKPNLLKKYIEARDFNIGDNVLVRYYLRKKWKYYIGLIKEIKEMKYKIFYYKTVYKKGDLRFVKPKRPDIDDIPDDLIIKQVDLMQVNEKNEFLLSDDEISVYF